MGASLLSSSGRIGGLSLKNRLLMAPMVRNYADEHGPCPSANWRISCASRAAAWPP